MLETDIDLGGMAKTIFSIKEEILKLKATSGAMQCVERNCDRMLASLAMLEINVADRLMLIDD